MKFADIAKRAKATKIACVLEDKNGEQWVDTGYAKYKLEGLPKMNSADFLRLAGVAEEKIDTYYMDNTEAKPEMLSNEVYGEIELTSDMAGLVVDLDGFRLMPFYTMLHGVVWVDVKEIEPVLKGKTDYLRFFLRKKGERFQIAVKDGMVLIALIWEYQMGDYLMQQVDTLYQQCMRRGVAKRTRKEGRT